MPDPSIKLGPGGFESSTDDRLLVALDAIIRSRFPALAFAGVYEYAVQSVGATSVRLLPTASGLPAPMLPPVSFPVAAYTVDGSSPTVGSTCLVAFVNCDPARPVVVPRAGDVVVAGKWTIVQTTTSSLTITYTDPSGSTTSHTIAVGGAAGVVITAGGTLTTKQRGTVGVGQ